MFKEGDYIVTLIVDNKSTSCARTNWIFQQRTDNNAIYPCIDLEGGTSNGNTGLTYDKQETLKDWRYATQQEIAYYEEIGKPYDVTSINFEPSYEIY